MEKTLPEYGRRSTVELAAHAAVFALWLTAAFALAGYASGDRYPGYFLEFVPDYDYRTSRESPEVERTRRVVEMWENVIVGIFVISALAFAFEALLRLVERLFVRWSGHY